MQKVKIDFYADYDLIRQKWIFRLMKGHGKKSINFSFQSIHKDKDIGRIFIAFTKRIFKIDGE